MFKLSDVGKTFQAEQSEVMEGPKIVSQERNLQSTMEQMVVVPTAVASETVFPRWTWDCISSCLKLESLRF